METLETLLIENRFKLLALHTEWQQGPGEFFENLMTTETRDFFLMKPFLLSLSVIKIFETPCHFIFTADLWYNFASYRLHCT